MITWILRYILCHSNIESVTHLVYIRPLRLVIFMAWYSGWALCSSAWEIRWTTSSTLHGGLCIWHMHTTRRLFWCALVSFIKRTGRCKPSSLERGVLITFWVHGLVRLTCVFICLCRIMFSLAFYSFTSPARTQMLNFEIVSKTIVQKGKPPWWLYIGQFGGIQTVVSSCTAWTCSNRAGRWRRPWWVHRLASVVIEVRSLVVLWV